MSKTITVNGVGSISLRPDTTVVSMTIKSLDKNYDKSMSDSAEMLSQLRRSLSEAGFYKDDLKTTNFEVCTENESIRDENGNYKTVFSGYSCIHSLRLEFPYDSERLSNVLSVISECVADPELDIKFTVKNKDAAKSELISNVAQSARDKAKALALASGVKLGNIISIDCSSKDTEFLSDTKYMMDGRCMALASSNSVHINPEDITVTDTITFVWEII